MVGWQMDDALEGFWSSLGQERRGKPLETSQRRFETRNYRTLLQNATTRSICLGFIYLNILLIVWVWNLVSNIKGGT
jgi:hypothetical protein